MIVTEEDVMINIRRMTTVLAVVFLLAVTLLLVTGIDRQAQAAGSDGDISRKLDDIINNQKAMMQEMEAIRSELNIIKIRITQQQ